MYPVFKNEMNNKWLCSLPLVSQHLLYLEIITLGRLVHQELDTQHYIYTRWVTPEGMVGNHTG